MIFPCKCQHDFQDSEYGKGNRLFNPTTKGWRCTICTAPRGDESKKKKEKEVVAEKGD